MAKRRKKRSAPNISAEAIERARQQLGDAESTEQPVEAQAADTDKPHESRQRRRRRERRERSGQAQPEIVQYSQISKRKRETLDHETI